jgi:hypothetical protein
MKTSADASRNPPGPAAERLEQRVSRLLEMLPPESAPADLVPRVWAQLARRRELPWWRRSVLDWPLPAQLAFLVAGLLLTAAVVSVHLQAPLPTPGRILSELPALHTLISLYGVVTRSASALLHTVPDTWLRGGLLLGFAAYTTLFALLALAYRLLIGRTAGLGSAP